MSAIVNPGTTGGGGGGGTSAVDKDPFVEGISSFTPAGGAFDDVLGADLAEDTMGVVRLTAKRAWHVNLRNVAGAEVGTAANPVRVDPTGTTTQPVSGAVTANQGGAPWTVDLIRVGGAAVTLGQKVMATSIPVVIASDQSAVPVVGTKADNSVNSTAKLPVLAALALSGPPVWTDGNEVPLAVDNTDGAMWVQGPFSAGLSFGATGDRSLITIGARAVMFSSLPSYGDSTVQFPSIDLQGKTWVTGAGQDNDITGFRLGTSPARANVNAPVWSEGGIVPLSVDLGGSLRVLAGTTELRDGRMMLSVVDTEVRRLVEDLYLILTEMLGLMSV